MMKLRFDGKHVLGECVLWCDRTQQILWTDIPAATLWCYQPVTGATRSWPMPERLGSFALTEYRDWLLLGLASQLAYFHLESGQIVPLQQVEASIPSTRLNDGRCDRQGGFVFGTLNEHPDRAPIGSFYRLDSSLTLRRLALPQAAIPNSICFSLAGNVMYYCDSLTKTIRCCDYDQGVVANDRPFGDSLDLPGVPDGSMIDSEGFLWNARWGGACIVRIHPCGKEIDRVIDVPVEQPTCATFGGEAFQELYFTTAREGLSAAQLARTPQAGGLFSVSIPAVAGLAESRFKGIPAPVADVLATRHVYLENSF